jgi:hypothetical protein
MDTRKKENQLNEQNKALTEELADLLLTDAQAEATKGGDSSTATAGQFPWQVSLRTVNGGPSASSPNGYIQWLTAEDDNG